MTIGQVQLRPTLALFLRELREDQSSLWTYLTRAGVCIVFIISLAVVAESGPWRASAPGLRLFETLLGLNLFFLVLIALTSFSSAIAEERESGTLGLLRMTHVSWLGLLLGKSTGRLTRYLFFLGMQIPCMVLCVTLGGISPKQIVGASLSLMVWAALLANIGLLASAYARRSSSAAAGFLMIWASLGAGASCITILLEDTSTSYDLSRLISPAIVDLGQVAGFTSKWYGTVLGMLSLSLGLFLLSWLVVLLVPIEARPTAKPKGRRRLLRYGRFKGDGVSHKLRHESTASIAGLLFVSVIIGFWEPVLSHFTYNQGVSLEDVYTNFLVGLAWCTYVGALIFAAHCVGTERKIRTTSVLATLPMGLTGVVRRRLVVAGTFFGILVLYLLAHVVGEMNREEEWFILLTLASAIAFQLANIFFYAMVLRKHVILLFAATQASVAFGLVLLGTAIDFGDGIIGVIAVVYGAGTIWFAGMSVRRLTALTD